MQKLKLVQQQYLSGEVWLRGEVLQARCHVGVASGLVDGSNQAVREEGAHTLGVAQAVHVDQLLGCAREGQASHVCWEVVDVGVWHSNGTGIGVNQSLVIRLQSSTIDDVIDIVAHVHMNTAYQPAQQTQK